MKNKMNQSELYHYKKFRSCIWSIVACLVAITCVGILFTAALIYQMPKTAIGLACLEVLILFVCKVNCSEADRHYRRAFPEVDIDYPFSP
jgi:hypothetical protein